MKILYISKLEGYNWQGPTHSVPMQIKHQAELDDVLWINLCPSIHEDWKQLSYYREMKEGLSVKFQDLPKEFQEPDIVVFEGVYEYPFAAIVSEIWKRKIPYVIVPRSALTKDAQKKKAVKKILGNFLFFGKFIRKATAIHYLTQAEQEDSKAWKTNSFVIPNGMLPKERIKTQFFHDGKLIFNYVGRVEKYQKGLDLLMKACARIADELRCANASIHLYGPDREGSFKDLLGEIKQYGLSDILFLHDGVFGEEKENVLLSSDVFLMTSRFEGLPMGLIEALAYGIPAAATKGTNLADEIQTADAGWTSDNTVEGIVDMIRSAISDRLKYTDKSTNALQLSKQYNWTGVAENTHFKYGKLIQR